MALNLVMKARLSAECLRLLWTQLSVVNQVKIVVLKAMDKKTTPNGRQVLVTNSSRYERDIEKCFLVIYHNLKRIQEDNSSGQNRCTRQRSKSAPPIPVPDPALLRKHKNSFSREAGSSSTSDTSEKLRNNRRKVSFSADIALSQEYWDPGQVGRESTDADQLRKVQKDALL